MKKTVLSAALAMLLALPAFAQSYSGGYGTGTPRASSHKHRGVRAEGISPADPDVVYENGQYVGRDPDPNVRLELRRDWTHD